MVRTDRKNRVHSDSDIVTFGHAIEAMFICLKIISLVHVQMLNCYI